MTRKTLFLLAVGSLIIFTLTGWAVMSYFGPVSLGDSLQQGLSFPLQLICGVVLGGLVGLLAWALINASYFSKTLDFFVQIIGPWRLNWLEIVLVSSCAGVGEEILFRGAIQPHLGIVGTSILFVLLHGYINPFNRPMTAYGIFMVLAICLLGWAAMQFGLVLAIVAHTVIDIILLFCLSRTYVSDTENIPTD